MRVIILSLSLFMLGAMSVFGQPSALTYQGRLTDNMISANGTYEMRFSLFNVPAGGTQAGSTIELTNVDVSNGVFTVQLDFGTDPFPFGQNRYLQIEVRRNSSEVYTPLSPRQQVTTTPYSIRALESNVANNSTQLGGIAFDQYVLDNDARLTDARPPTAGSGNYIHNGTSTQSSSNFDISGMGESSIFNARTQFNLNGSRILSSPGTNNTLVGINAGTDLTSGDGNTFVGRNAGTNTANGRTNTFIGSGAGVDNISGSSNSFFGFNSGLRVTSGDQNSIFGVSAGSGNLTGNQNSIFGYEAGLLATGSRNSFFGATSGRATTSGVENSFFGDRTGLNNTTGNFNVFVGAQAGSRNTIGSENVYVGALAGQFKQTGERNSFFGSGAGQNGGTGSGNSFFGWQAGNQTAGSDNTFVGLQAGFFNVQGVANTFVGVQAGQNNDDGVFNTVVGHGADLSETGLTRATVIGAGAIGEFSNTVQLGRDGIDKVRIGFAEGIGNQHLCMTSQRIIGICAGSLHGEAAVTEVATLQNLVKELQTQIETRAEENKQLKTTIEILETKLDEQKGRFEDLRLLVCAGNQDGEICREEEKNNDE